MRKPRVLLAVSFDTWAGRYMTVQAYMRLQLYSAGAGHSDQLVLVVEREREGSRLEKEMQQATRSRRTRHDLSDRLSSLSPFGGKENTPGSA